MGRDDQIAGPALRPRRPRWFKKLDQGGKTRGDEAANAGLKVETAAGFRRDAALPGVPAAAVHGSVFAPPRMALVRPPAPGPTNGSCSA